MISQYQSILYFYIKKSKIFIYFYKKLKILSVSNIKKIEKNTNFDKNFFDRFIFK